MREDLSELGKSMLGRDQNLILCENGLFMAKIAAFGENWQVKFKVVDVSCAIYLSRSCAHCATLGVPGMSRSPKS
jgi:hypothetical protein